MDLNELKQNSVPVPSATPQEPQIIQGNNQEDTGFVPGITQGTSIPRRVDISNGTGAPQRVKADMSQIAKPDEAPDGVIQKETLAKDILEGDVFNNYRKSKNEYYAEEKEKVQAEEAENRLIAEQNGNLEYQEDDFGDIVSEENSEETYKAIDVMNGAPEASSVFVEDNTVPEGLPPEVNDYPVETEVLPGAKDESVDKEESTTYGSSITEDKDDEEDTTIGIDVEVSSSSKEDDEEEVSEEEQISILKSMVTAKLKPIKKRLNLSSYTISKKINANSVIETNDIPAAKWFLPYTGIVIMMKRFSGSELESIRSALEDNGNGNEDYRTVLNIIYNHIISPKPKSFNAWLRSICFFDYEHLFFAAYIAGFNGTNYVPIECTNAKCSNKIRTYLTDDIPFMNMVKYKDEKIEAAMKELYNSEAYEAKGLALSEVVPITDKVAIGFQMPSLYSALLESKHFDKLFRDKYANTISALPYIDNLYIINEVTHELEPVGFKIYDNNISKTSRSRVMRYDSYLSSFTSDEYTLVEGIINDIGTKIDMVSYFIPKTNCPFCGWENDAVENQSAIQLLFTRNRLGLLATS